MSPPLPAHQVQLLQGSEAFFDALIAAIDRSVHEVRLETYIFSVESSGEGVAQALERAALRGVSVYLVVDGVGTPEIPQSWARRFDAAGLHWRVFLPLGRVGLLIPSRWRRLHRKLCVVDGEVAFCGGINLLDDYVDPNHGMLKAPRLDFSVRVSGPLVATAHEVMAHFWWRLNLGTSRQSGDFASHWRSLRKTVRRALHERLEAQPSQTAAPQGHQDVQASLVLRDNLLNRARIERAYRKAIGEASHEIIIANAYFLPGRKLRQGLIHAAQRGVRVRLLLQGRYEYFMQYHASRPVYGALLAAGVEIHEYSLSFLHAKVAVIDDHWATVGSSNLDPLSLLLAREANVLVDDPRFAAELRARLEQAMATGGARVDAQAYLQRPWRQRLLDRLAFGLMRLMLFLLGKRY